MRTKINKKTFGLRVCEKISLNYFIYVVLQILTILRPCHFIPKWPYKYNSIALHQDIHLSLYITADTITYLALGSWLSINKMLAAQSVSVSKCYNLYYLQRMFGDSQPRKVFHGPVVRERVVMERQKYGSF